MELKRGVIKCLQSVKDCNTDFMIALQSRQSGKGSVMSFLEALSPSLDRPSGFHRGRSPLQQQAPCPLRRDNTAEAALHVQSTRSYGSHSCSSVWEQVGDRGWRTELKDSGFVLCTQMSL